MPLHQLPLSRVAIIGGGKMGEAILAGLLHARSGSAALLKTDNLVVVNTGLERRAVLQSRYKVPCVEKIDQLEPCSLVILAVKPQVVPQVLPELANCPWVARAYVLSIAAGISTASIEEALPRGVKVVRAMPNTPLTVGSGITAVCAGSSASSEDALAAQALFEALGQAVVVDESQMDAVTAVSGSGPAYVAALIEAMVQAGEELGLESSVAESLATATVEGTAVLLRKTGQGATQTRLDVCSPGGTTLAALEAMENQGFSRSIVAGVHAAAVRSKELSQ